MMTLLRGLSFVLLSLFSFHVHTFLLRETTGRGVSGLPSVFGMMEMVVYVFCVFTCKVLGFRLVSVPMGSSKLIKALYVY